MFLLCAVILAHARDAQAQCVSIKLQTCLSITDYDRRVINTQKQLVFTLPLLITFAGRELKNLEPVLVRITKVERLDATCVFVPIRETLWTSRSMFDF